MGAADGDWPRTPAETARRLLMGTDCRAPGPRNSLTTSRLRVGHHTAIGDGYLTGTTVVLAPDGGMVAGVDVRGGGPATHETDLLDPTASVAADPRAGADRRQRLRAGGLHRRDERRWPMPGSGCRSGPNRGEVVPLVPGAALFDLGRGGDFRARPTAEFGAVRWPRPSQ